MEPSLAVISHIAKDSSDFKNTLDKHYPNGITLSTCDIKSLYINIFVIQHLNTGLKNYKMIYRYCNVLINDLCLKACR